MTYAERVLREGETLHIACRQHWIVFASAIILAVLGLVLFAAAAYFPPGAAGSVVLDYLGDLALLLALFHFVRAGASWLSTEIAVSDRRVLYKRGLFSRRTIEMNISKVETVDVEQGPLGVLLDFGDVVVRGTGGSFEPLRHVASPIRLRNAILVG